MVQQPPQDTLAQQQLLMQQQQQLHALHQQVLHLQQQQQVREEREGREVERGAEDAKLIPLHTFQLVLSHPSLTLSHPSRAFNFLLHVTLTLSLT